MKRWVLLALVLGIGAAHAQAPQMVTPPGVVTATGGTTARTLAARAADVVNAKDYGVKCDGVTDDTAALQAFLSAITAGKRGVLPEGTCLFSNTLTLANSQATLIGSGAYSTVLKYVGASTTSDLLLIGGQAATTLNLDIEGFRVASVPQMTVAASAAIHVKNVGRSIFRNVIADGQDGNLHLWNGFWFDQVDDVHLMGFEAWAQNDALRVNGTVGSGAKADLLISHGKIGNSAVGVHVGGAFGGFVAETTDDIGNGTNVLVDTALASENNRELFFGDTFVVDSAATGDNYLINDALANSGTIAINGWVASSGAGNGIHVQNWKSSRISVASPIIFNNHLDGIRVDDASAALWISPHTIIANNGGWGVNATVATNNLTGGSLPNANTLGTYSTDANIESFSATTLGTGFQKFPNGAIHQWGAVSVTGAANTFLSVNANFPVPFPSHVISVTPVIHSWANGAMQMTVDYDGGNLTSATFVLVASGTVTTAQPIQWDAWGN